MPPRKKIKTDTADTASTYEAFIKKQVALLTARNEVPDVPSAVSNALKVLDANRSQTCKKALTAAVTSQLATQLEMLDVELASKRRALVDEISKHGSVTIDTSNSEWLQNLPPAWDTKEDVDDDLVIEYEVLLERLRKSHEKAKYMKSQKAYYTKVAEALDRIDIPNLNACLLTPNSEIVAEIKRTPVVIEAATARQGQSAD